MTQETIAAFGEQWKRYDHHGRSLDDDYLQNVLGPLFNLSDLKGLTVADVGAGNGRFTAILAKYASHVVSVEPACEAMKNNQSRNAGRENVSFLTHKAQDLTSETQVDMIFCIGVLHHIPDMTQALTGILHMLKPEGRLVLWLYGREGNGLYIFFMKVLKIFTTWIPDAWLGSFSRFLVKPVKAYARWTTKNSWLPMAGYFNQQIAQLSDHEIELVIFDQLNPTTAYYLTRQDIEALLKKQGMNDLKFYHRHHYSWTVLARRAA